MALVVEDGTGKSNADAYDSVANVDTYLRDHGHIGTAQNGSPLVDGALAANAAVLDLDGLTSGDTVLKGDRFTLADTPGEYKFTRAGVADSGGAITTLTFSPALPESVADDVAITILGATDAQVRRATQFLDTMFGPSLKGRKANSDQALELPRYGMTDGSGFSVDSDTIPDRWKDACAEATRIIGTDRKFNVGALIESVRAGTAAVKFGGQGQPTNAVVDFIRGLVAIYLRPPRVVRA